MGPDYSHFMHIALRIVVVCHGVNGEHGKAKIEMHATRLRAVEPQSSLRSKAAHGRVPVRAIIPNSIVL